MDMDARTRTIIFIVILSCSSIYIIYYFFFNEDKIKKYRYGIMFHKFLYKIFCFQVNKTKYIKNNKNNDVNYVVIKFKEEEKCKCDICDLNLDEIDNRIIINDKQCEFKLDDYLMTFKCCKYSKKICKKCFTIHYFNIFTKSFRSLYNDFNCIFCTLQVYILQLETEFIKILVNN